MLPSGVVHGDLKAANIMLTQAGDEQTGVWAAAYGHKVCALLLHAVPHFQLVHSCLHFSRDESSSASGGCMRVADQLTQYF
jgi:hypothetical protein